MAVADLTPARVRALFDYDSRTGVLTWRVGAGRVKAGAQVCAQRPGGYLCARVDGKIRLAHRLAWAHHFGEWPKHSIDHIDGCTSNNRIENLRDVSHSVNMHNQRRAAHHNRSSKLIGAHWHKRDQRWRSNITVGGVARHLGFFDSEQQAHDAYIAAKRLLHEGGTL